MGAPILNWPKYEKISGDGVLAPQGRWGPVGQAELGLGSLLGGGGGGRQAAQVLAAWSGGRADFQGVPSAPAPSCPHGQRCGLGQLRILPGKMAPPWPQGVLGRRAPSCSPPPRLCRQGWF